MKANLTHTIGRRKTSIARAFLKPGTGVIVVNNRTLEDYFPRETHRIRVLEPLHVVGEAEKVDVSLTIVGGGITGQTDAARLAIARALLKVNEERRKAFREAGLLTRDSREVERKKYGRHKARRGNQFSKR